MKNLDLFSKRILVIAISITMILLSSSLLIFTSNKAIAAPPQSGNNSNSSYCYDAVAVGHHFVMWNTKNGTHRFMTHSSSSKSNW